MAKRYAIVAVIFALVLFFVCGYYHARRRLSRGQEPLAYHRWMVRNRLRNMSHAQSRNAWPHHSNAPAYGQSYPMDEYPPPPPAYEAPPPVYQPPQGATKAMADQNFSQTNRAGESSASGGTAGPPDAARQ